MLVRLTVSLSVRNFVCLYIIVGSPLFHITLQTSLSTIYQREREIGKRERKRERETGRERGIGRKEGTFRKGY